LIYSFHFILKIPEDIVYLGKDKLYPMDTKPERL
jgi:hypothetical protein